MYLNHKVLVLVLYLLVVVVVAFFPESVEGLKVNREQLGENDILE